MEELEDQTEQVQEHVNHSAQHGGDRLTLWVALTAAFLAALAAVTNLMSGHHSNEAMVEQIRASDAWSHYQAKSIKATVLATKKDIFEAMGKKLPDESSGKLDQYHSDQEDISQQAKELEASSEHHLGRHLIFARGVTMFQVAIAIAAISALSRRRLFWYVSLGFGAVGLVFLIWGFIPAL